MRSMKGPAPSGAEFRLSPQDFGEVGGWRFAFVPLAIERCRPFLGRAGIAPELIEEPAVTSSIARAFLHETAWSLAEGRQLDKYLARVGRVLSRAIQQLVSACGV